MNVGILMLGLCTIVAVSAFIIFLRTILDEKPAGRIVINTSDPMKDVYTLELDIPFGELDRSKRVIFEIIKE